MIYKRLKPLFRNNIHLILLITANIIFLNKNIKAENISIKASVNNEIITNVDLRNRYNFFIKTTNIKNSSKSEEKFIINQILNKLIDENIQRQEARKLKITINNLKVEEILTNMAISQGFSNLEDFKKDFKKNKISYQQYQKQIKSQLLWKEVIFQKVKPRIAVNESDINEMIELQKINVKKTNFKLAKIFIPFKDKQEEKDALAIITKLATELKDNVHKFNKISQQFSSNNNISNNEIEWIEDTDLNPEILKNIQELKIKDTSNPIKLADGYYIFKIIDKTIKINLNKSDENQIRQIIFYRKLDLAAKKYLNQIKKEAYIKIK